MRSLATAAVGLVIVVLDVSLNGWDLVADPAGWLLVLMGMHDLRGHPRHRLLVTLAALALAVSVLLWFPGAAEALDAGPVALGWVATLPQVAWCGLAAYTLAGIAGAAGDDTMRTALQVVAVGFAASAVLPVLAVGVVVPLLVTGALAALASLVALIVLLFMAARRPWAGAPEPSA